MEEVDEKNLPTHKIFWVDDDYKKNIVFKFTANSDEEAYKQLVEYCNKFNDHSYYYGRIHYVKCITSDKKVVVRNTDEDFLIDYESKNLFVRIFDKIKDFFEWWIWQKPIDLWYKIKDIAYLLKYHEDRTNQWNLDYHLLDSIELNVPSLIKYSHCLAFLDEAIIQMFGDDVDFDLHKYHIDHCQGYPKEVEDLAVKIQHDEYNKILQYVKLYKYYSNYGIVDPRCKADVEFDKEWRHTIPVKIGTYDEFDYNKLNDMCNELWNNIWDWVKKYGQKLND